MEDYMYNRYDLIISAISLLITIIGLYAVYVQIRKIRETTWSNTHSKLTEQSFELLKFLSDNPETYDYFYKKKQLEPAEPNKIKLLYAAEALANFMEHLVLQQENLPAKQWEVWKRFIKTTFKASIVMRNFIQENREWYSQELLDIADECKVLYD